MFRRTTHALFKASLQELEWQWATTLATRSLGRGSWNGLRLVLRKNFAHARVGKIHLRERHSRLIKERTRSRGISSLTAISPIEPQLGDTPAPGSRLPTDRERYVEYIAQYLPTNLHVRDFSKAKRHSKDDALHSSAETHSSVHDPLGDWRTALEMLKMNHKSAPEIIPSKNTGLFRPIFPAKQKYGVKKTIQPPEKPGIWTQQSLAVYIRDLTNFRPPRPVLFEVLPDDAKRQSLASVLDVANTIERVLHDTELRHAISIEACNIALQYFYDKEMFDRARRLYFRMEYLCLDTTTETWNIMLRACASYRDAHSFIWLLNQMLKREMPPNSATWAILVMLPGDQKFKQTIINEMEIRGLMVHPGVLRDIATQMVQYEYAKHSANHASVSPFFDRMNNQYGRDWLSTSTANILISEILRTATHRIIGIVQALRLLYEMKQHSFGASSSTLDILLKEGSKIGRQDLVVDIVDIFETHWALKPGPNGHARLFRYAWHFKKLNMLRAVWASACLNGFVTLEMQHLILRSVLSEDEKTQSPDRPQGFVRLAGWFALSVDPAKPILGEAEMRWKPETIERSAELGSLAIKSNLATAGQARLTDGLVACLRRALAVDTDWSAQEFWQDRQKQDTLLGKRAQIDLTLSDNAKFMNQSSTKALVERLVQKRSRRLKSTVDLRHKTESASLTGMKLGSITGFAKEVPRQLTFQFKPPRKRHRRPSDSQEPHRTE